MKKALILLLILIIVPIAGCNGERLERRSDRTKAGFTPQFDYSIPPDLSTLSPVRDDFSHTDYLNIVFIAGTGNKYYNLTEWQEYIKGKHDIDILVRYPDNSSEIIDKSATLDSILYIHNTGVYKAGSQMVFKAGSPETAYELSPYYEKYQWHRYFDSDFIERLRSGEGIYAVPSFVPKFTYPRYYNKEYLVKLGMGVPETVFEFHDFLRGSKDLQGDGGGYCPMWIREQRLARQTSDIFRAYGAYVNSVSDSAVAFSPLTGAVEDAVFSPDFEHALDFIKNLQAEGLLFISGQDGFDGTFTTKFDGESQVSDRRDLATGYREIVNPESGKSMSDIYCEPGYENLQGYYLTASNNRAVCEVIYAPSFYVFPKGMENIQGVIDLFNDVLTEGKYYADLRYGIEGTDYEIIDGAVAPLKPPAGSFVDLKQLAPVDDLQSSQKPESTAALMDIPGSLKYEVNIFNDFNVYLTSTRDGDYLGFSYPGYFGSLFNKEISAYDAIEFYKKEFARSGEINLLEEFNDKLGMTATYDYPVN